MITITIKFLNVSELLQLIVDLKMHKFYCNNASKSALSKFKGNFYLKHPKCSILNNFH